MSGIAGSLMAALKLAPRFLFAIWVFGAIVLLLPDGPASQFGIDTFRTTYRLWLGPGTLASFCIWLTHALVGMWSWARKKLHARKRRRFVLEELAHLSQDERRLLGYFLYCGAPTQNLLLNYPPARSLCSKGLMFGASGTGNMLNWPYTIPAFVWERLTEVRDEQFPGLDSPQAAEAFGRFKTEMHDKMLYGGL